MFKKYESLFEEVMINSCKKIKFKIAVKERSTQVE